MKVELKGNYPRIQKSSIHQNLVSSQDEISITNCEISFGLIELAPLGILTVAVLKFWYDYEKERKRDKNWDIEKIQRIIEKKIHELGYFSFISINYDNPNNLINPSELKPCIISVLLENGNEIKLKLYRTGGL